MRRSIVVVVLVVLVSACSFKAFDFNGDNKADYVWRDQSTGVWYEGSVPGAPVRSTGAASDIPVAADYDGDGRYDIAVVKANGDWVEADGTVIKAAFPAAGASSNAAPIVPVPGDYDGDKKAEPAWFRTSDGVWIFADGSTKAISGGPTDPTTCCLLNLDGRVPVPADYDGDGTTDVAVFNPLTGDWTIERSTDGTTEVVRVLDRPSLASPFQLPVPADYDGVGRAQPAIFDSYGWHIAGRSEVIPFVAPLGTDSFPAPADYDGDGKVDLSYVTLDGKWYTQGQPVPLTLLGVTPSTYLRSIPAELPSSLVFNIARLTLLGRNLFECERRLTPDCAGY